MAVLLRATLVSCMLLCGAGLVRRVAVPCGTQSPLGAAFPSCRNSCPDATTRDRCRRCLAVMANAPSVKRVAIIGAGIGGLTLANALHTAEMAVDEVRVFEKFDSVKPGVGGGVQINSGAVILSRLGLGDAVNAASNPVERILSRTVGGRVILDLDVQKMVRSDPAREAVLADRNGRLMVYTIMRDRLMQILAGNLPKNVLTTGREVVSILQSSSGATLKFADGATEGPFDLIVGADGIKGAAREAVRGTGSDSSKVNGIYSGIRIQFGVAHAGQRPPGSEREVHQWFGGDTYGLSATYGGIHGDKYEMLAAVFHDSGRKEENAEWDRVAAQGACLRRLEERGFPTEMQAVADASERFYELGVYYRNPLEGWIGKHGQVVLLGDAAHAMPPNLGQGANQAIQDAYCLAEQLARLNRQGRGNIMGALQDYERRRKPVTASVLAKSVFVGFVETLEGTVGEAIRDNFFFTTWKLGVAEKIFMDGALPKV